MDEGEFLKDIILKIIIGYKSYLNFSLRKREFYNYA